MDVDALPGVLPALDRDCPPARWIGDALLSARTIPDFGADVTATLDWAAATGTVVRSGTPTSMERWQLLAATAFQDVGAARILEPHLDALSILAEASAEGFTDAASEVVATDGATWGVFAAEGSAMRLEARADGGAWRLTGTKPWCSLAGRLSHALVTAWIDDTRRQLFAVALHDDAVTAHRGPWRARGLTQVVSAPVDFDGAFGAPVGDPGWYLERPGFAAGGIGVAAVWWGGASGLLPALQAAAVADRADQIARLHLGGADAALWAARAALAQAARSVDRREPDVDHRLLAARVREIVAGAAESVLQEAAQALGPHPLVADESHARRVADLELYLRQHHGRRDTARLGRLVAEARSPW